MSSYARQGFHYNRNLLSQGSTTRDAENGSLISVGGGGGGRGRSVKNNGQRNPPLPHLAGGIQRFSRQNRIMALSQTDDQDGQEIMVDHAAGGEFSLSQGTEITLTQALLPEPDETKQQQQRSSRSFGVKNDDHRLTTTTSNHRHLAGRTPRAIGGRGGGGMNNGTNRGGLQQKNHRASTPSNQKRRQIQQQNIQLSQKKKNHPSSNPNHQTTQHHSMVGNTHRNNFTTPVAGSGRLLTSSKSVNGLLSQSMHEEDDASTIQSRSLLTQESQGGGGSRFGGQQQQHSRKRSTLSSSTPHNNGQQQQHQSTMSMTSNTTHQRIPSLATSRRPVSTAVRTLGGISTTLATLATPSKAFRSMTSFAARTAARTGATLGLTPCNFRSSRSSSTALLSSSARLSSGTVRPTSGGVRMSLSKSVGGGGANGILVKRSQEEDADDDDASKVTQKTYDPNDEKESLATAKKEADAAVANDEKKKMDDFLSKVQTAMDEKMKQFDERLNEMFTEKKHELDEFFERSKKSFKESVSKIEGIQDAMDAFPAKIASSVQEHEVEIRQLMGRSKEEIEKEGVRVVESISSKVHAVADEEAKKTIGEVLNNVIATAKSDFQVWTDGVLAGMRSSMIGKNRPVAAVSGEESTNEGEGLSSTVETEHCAEKEDCQSPTVFSGEEVKSDHRDKENELPEQEEEEATLDEEVDDVETKRPIVETQTQSDGWSDEEEEEEEEGATGEKVEVMKKGATPFSSKATPSTTTTPFSRKKTPVKNNYGKNRRAMQSYSTAHEDNDDDFKSKVQHGQKVQSSRAKEGVSSSKKRHACRASPSSPKIALKLSSSKKKRVESPLPLSPRIENGKAKSAKKAHKCESKHKIKAKPPRRQKSPSHSQASKEESMQSSSKVRTEQKNSNDHVSKPATNPKVTKKTDPAPRFSQPSEAKPSRTKKSESVPQRSDKKRDQSAVNVETNPRRSKRLKESTRAEKAAAALKTRAEQAALKTQKKKTKAAKAKQVTPLDGGARQSQSKVASNFQNQNPPLSRSNDDDHLDTDLHVYPSNDDVDQLLGTSIVVDTSVGGGNSSSSGLDPDDGLVDKPKAKLFTPFRARDKKSKKKYGRKSNKSKKAAVSMNAGKNKAQKPESVFSFKINW